MRDYPTFDRPHCDAPQKLSIEQVWENIDHLNAVQDSRIALVLETLADNGVRVDTENCAGFVQSLEAFEAQFAKRAKKLRKHWAPAFERQHLDHEPLEFSGKRILFSFAMDLSILIFAFGNEKSGGRLMWWPEAYVAQEAEPAAQSNADLRDFAHVNRIVVKGLEASVTDVGGGRSTMPVYPNLESLVRTSLDLALTSEAGLSGQALSRAVEHDFLKHVC